MTANEKELIAALESDIQKWEFVAGYFEHDGVETQTFDGDRIPGRDYAAGLRRMISEHRELIERIKRG